MLKFVVECEYYDEKVMLKSKTSQNRNFKTCYKIQFFFKICHNSLKTDKKFESYDQKHILKGEMSQNRNLMTCYKIQIFSKSAIIISNLLSNVNIMMKNTF